MVLKPVESSMIHALGYSRESRTLEVVFNSGGVYFYEGVPRRVYHALLHAPSLGKFMHEHIIGVYPYHSLKERRRAG